MRTIRTLLVAAAILLPACACDTRPVIDSALPSRLPTEAPWLERDRDIFRYEPLPESYRQEVHRACSDCAEVEFHYFFVDAPEFRLRLKRAELPISLLPALQRVPQWYEADTPGVELELGHVPSVTFYDAEGRELFCAAFYPAGRGYVREGNRYLSMWELCRRHFLQNN